MNDRNPADETARELRKILDHHRKCPPSETLVAFHEDELAPADGATVAAHLGNCTDCARLIEQLVEAEGPMMEDASYRAAREEDRHQVAKALGFRVGRPPAKPLFERLSWLWESRVPAMVPAAACALLLAVILWPAPAGSPVTEFDWPFQFISEDPQTRGPHEISGEYDTSLNALVLISHYFPNQQVDDGTMVSCEVTSPEGTDHLRPRTVIMAQKEGADTEEPCVQLSLQFSRPGTYHLRLSHPENAFKPVVLKINVRAN